MFVRDCTNLFKTSKGIVLIVGSLEANSSIVLKQSCVLITLWTRSKPLNNYIHKWLCVLSTSKSSQHVCKREFNSSVKFNNGQVS